MRCILKPTLLLMLSSMTLLADRPWHAYPRHHRGWGHREAPRMSPPWHPHQRPGRVMAFIPGDSRHAYVYSDGCWVLRRLDRPRHQYHCEAPRVLPPVPLPRLGLSLHWVLD